MTLHEIAILSRLEENGPMFHNDLAIRVGIDKAKLVPLARGLLSASLLLKDVAARIDQIENELFASLSEDERRILSKRAARLLTLGC